MDRMHWIRLGLPAAAIGALVFMLGLYGPTAAQSPKSHEPFANATAQQAEMIQLLKEINLQLKEQNSLLRTGVLQVTVVEPAKAAPNKASRLPR